MVLTDSVVTTTVVFPETGSVTDLSTVRMVRTKRTVLIVHMMNITAVLESVSEKRTSVTE